MKFADLDGARIQPAPKLRAKCPFCGSEIIARCGKVRVWHWAHKTTTHCDHWWEPEKQWHRDWKDQFPEERQEQGRRDENGELHIADVLTPQGLALEFQHSAISREEVEVRTRFHGNICWIVDGLRLKTTLEQFVNALKHADLPRSSGATVYKVYYYDSRFLKKWSGLNAPVVIDFGMDDVWVVGKSMETSALMYTLGRDQFVEQLKMGNRPPPVQVTQPKRVRRYGAFRRRRYR